MLYGGAGGYISHPCMGFLEYDALYIWNIEVYAGRLPAFGCTIGGVYSEAYLFSN